jgi:hypothetical protein
VVDKMNSIAAASVTTVNPNEFEFARGTPATSVNDSTAGVEPPQQPVFDEDETTLVVDADDADPDYDEIVIEQRADAPSPDPEDLPTAAPEAELHPLPDFPPEDPVADVPPLNQLQSRSRNSKLPRLATNFAPESTSTRSSTSKTKP